MVHQGFGNAPTKPACPAVSHNCSLMGPWESWRKAELWKKSGAGALLVSVHSNMVLIRYCNGTIILAWFFGCNYNRYNIANVYKLKKIYPIKSSTADSVKIDVPVPFCFLQLKFRNMENDSTLEIPWKFLAEPLPFNSCTVLVWKSIPMVVSTYESEKLIPALGRPGGPPAMVNGM